MMSPSELFHDQTRTYVQALTSGVLGLEHNPAAVEQLEKCARAARSLKVAAHVAGLRASAELAQAIENCFATARLCKTPMRPEQMALSLRGVDVLEQTAEAARNAAPGLPPYPPASSITQPQSQGDADRAVRKNKRVLAVDDSLEIRELECRLLSFRGYEVDIAVDGIDAWNAVRTGGFDLVLTDIDMPLVDGLRLTRLIKNDPRLQALAVVIACDRDSEIQRRQGFEAGADYYVIKDRFHDTLVQTIASLIGPAHI